MDDDIEEAAGAWLTVDRVHRDTVAWIGRLYNHVHRDRVAWSPLGRLGLADVLSFHGSKAD